MEAQFAIRNIVADDTKFDYFVAALGQDTAQRILNLIQNPPADNKYQGIKDQLTGTFDQSSHKRAARISNMSELEAGNHHSSWMT